MNRFTRKFQPLQLLPDEQIEEMHNGCLRILNSTGVIFQSERALKLFENAGCKVKHDEMRGEHYRIVNDIDQIFVKKVVKN